MIQLKCNLSTTPLLASHFCRPLLLRIQAKRARFDFYRFTARCESLHQSLMPRRRGGCWLVFRSFHGIYFNVLASLERRKSTLLR